MFPKGVVGARARFGGVAIAEEPLHVGRIEHDRVQRGLGVRQVSAVHSGGDVRREQIVAVGVHAAPEDALAVGHVRDARTRRHVQGEHFREHIRVRANMGGDD